KQVAQIVQARTAAAEPSLLLDARGLGVALRDDEAPELIAEFSRDFLPHGPTEEIAEADPAIVDRIRQKDAPAVLGQLHVLEMRPSGWIDADGGSYVHLVVVLEALRPHVAPPLNVFRLPVLQRALQPPVARQPDVVGNSFGGYHGVFLSMPFGIHVHVLLKSNSGRDCDPYAVSAPFSPTAFGRWKIQFCHAVSRPNIFVSIVSGPAKRRLASMPVRASGDSAARASIASRTSSSQSSSSGANETSPASYASRGSNGPSCASSSSTRDGSPRKRVCRCVSPLLIFNGPASARA